MGDLTDEEREAIRQGLLAWRAEGEPSPVIPAYRDEDGDGVPDFYGLGEGDELVLVSGATVADTVAVSDGSGIEQQGEVA